MGKVRIMVARGMPECAGTVLPSSGARKIAQFRVWICTNVEQLLGGPRLVRAVPAPEGDDFVTMRTGDVPAEVRRFILTSIPSVPYLEAVLLLRAEPATDWDAARLARRLYVAEKVAGELLQQLAANGVAAESAPGVGWRYAPASELQEIIDRLAAAYAADLVAVTDLIHSRIDKRAQQFADAFRFRKE